MSSPLPSFLMLGAFMLLLRGHSVWTPFAKHNVAVFLAFTGSWTASLALERAGISGRPTDLASFVALCTLFSALLGARSILWQASAAILQLELSRRVILGSYPDIDDYMASGAHLFVLAAVASVFVAEALRSGWTRVRQFRQGSSRRCPD